MRAPVVDLMKKFATLLWVLLMLLSGITTFAAQMDAPVVAVPSVPAVTRLVQVFSVLERDVEEYAQQGNVDALDALLTNDFEMRLGAMPGNPVPRARWLRETGKARHGSFSIRQMAVHDYVTIAVVSFLLKQDKTMHAAGDIFIVDIWKQSGNTWQLAVRYASPAGSQHAAMPEFSTDAPQLDKRY